MARRGYEQIRFVFGPYADDVAHGVYGDDTPNGGFVGYQLSPAEKLAIVQETYEPGVTVSLVARRHGIATVGPQLVLTSL